MSIGAGAAAGAIQGTIINPGWGTLIGAIVGAAIGALTLAIPIDKPKGQKLQDIYYTTSIRNTVVALVLGRARASGNYLELGAFLGIKDKKKNQPGRRLRIMHAQVGLCEGPIQSAGNTHLDDKPLKEQARIEEFPVRERWPHPVWEIIFTLGDKTETVNWLITDSESKINPPYIPYRDTATSIIHSVMGDSPRMANWTWDIAGPDLTVLRDGATADPTGLETSQACGGYDGHTESFWFVPATSANVAGPYCLARVPRSAVGRTYTQPPSAIVGTVLRAWYLGRHDLVVVQDPGDTNRFWFGRWGYTSTDPGWSSVVPAGPGGAYANPILAHYLDELHGYLHTVHEDTVAGVRYIVRFNLLSGRVERLDTALPAGTYKALLYSPDFDAYWVATSTQLHMVEAHESGAILMSTSAVTTSSCIGLCVSGQRVGVITASGMTYFDPYESTSSATYGNNTAGVGKGNFGSAVFAAQNSWTGQVTLIKNGAALYLVNFIPSVPEHIEDVSAMGTAGEEEFQWVGGEAAYPAANAVTDAFRDWSPREPAAWDLVALEGRSSVAAAMWATQVSEANLDSARWGAGSPPKYFHLPAFEHFHAYCVGAMRYATSERRKEDGTVEPATDRWAERAKLDMLIDSESNAADLLTEMLAVVNGYRYELDGKLYVGVPRRGGFACWHFTRAQMRPGSLKFSYVDRGTGTNEVRIEFNNVRDDYRADFAEAVSPWQQDATGFRRTRSPTIRGIGRQPHAAWLAKLLLDTFGSTRRVGTFETSYRGMIVVPGDLIEITDEFKGLDRLLARVTEVHENRALERVEIFWAELATANDALKIPSPGVAPPPGDGSDPHPENCDEASGPSGNIGTISWFGNGQLYQPATYRVAYVEGVYRKDITWDYAVQGYDVVTRDGTGAIVVLGAAPAVADPAAPGYADQEEAEAANAGQATNYATTISAPIGLRRQVGGDALPAGDRFPTYELCVIG